jgi:2-polyprenyl-3-methyl-5-hydroxy-6-metoxy-1,4-benzoquinol methylase
MLSEETACPLCARRDYAVVSRTDRRGAPLRTVMCNACGLVWTNPRPSDEEMDRYYETEYRLDYARSRTPTRRKLLRGFLGAMERREWLDPWLAPGATVLDIGAGAGELVFVLRQQRFDASGIEPGQEFAGFCREVLKVPIQTATVDRAQVGSHSQSLITMFHMLEHVTDPRRTLARISEWLVPGTGRLVVEVPNVLSTVQAPRHRFHYAHLYNYSIGTLAGFGAAAGLTLVSWRETADGGNIVAVFAAAGSPGRLDEGALAANARTTRELLRRHGTASHYATPTPYRRLWQKLRRRWQEDRLLAGRPTVDALIAWARRLAAPK